LIVALFKRLKLNETVIRNGGWKELNNRGTLMLGRTVGIIGVGAMGRGLVQQISLTPGIECVALADLNVRQAIERSGGRVVALEIAQEGDRRTMGIDVDLRGIEAPQIVAQVGEAEGVLEVRWTE